MANKNLKFVLVKNNLPNAKEPYTGQFVSNGTTTLDAFAEKVCLGRTNIDAPTLKLILQTAFTYIAEDMAENIFRYATGLLTFEPAIDGSLPSMDAALGADNTVYIAVRINTDFLREVAALSPTRDVEDAINVKIDDVLDVEADKRQQITGTLRFQLTGKNISASNDGEKIEVVGSDNAAVPCTIVEHDGMGQRIVAEATSSAKPGKGAIVLTTRGYATPDAELMTLKKNVTILDDSDKLPRLTKLMKDGLVGEVMRLYGTYEIAGKNIPEMEDIADARLAVYDAEGQFLAKTKLTAPDAPQKNTFTRESSTRVIYKLGTNNSIEPDGTWEDPTSQCKFEIELKSGVVLDIPFRFAEE